METKNSGSSIYELLKPFATMLAIILGVLAVQWIFHLQLNSLDLSFSGNTASLKKIDEKSIDAGNAIVDVNGKIAGLQAQIDSLTQRVTGQGPPPQAEASGAPALSASTGSDGTRTSDSLAALFKPVIGTQSPLAGKDGYIFIGNRHGDLPSLEHATLGAVGGSPVPLDQLQPDDVYQTLANLVMRAGQPQNDAAYFNGQRSLGILPRGTQVTMLAAPQPIKRSDSLIQVWAHVRVNE
jgi:hypothetical protein